MNQWDPAPVIKPTPDRNKTHAAKSNAAIAAVIDWNTAPAKIVSVPFKMNQKRKSLLFKTQKQNTQQRTHRGWLRHGQSRWGIFQLSCGLRKYEFGIPTKK